MPWSDLHDLTITQALAEMEAGRVRSRDLVEALIERCEAGADLNAFVSTDWNALRRAADAIDESGRAGRGLGGIPLCFKDNIATGVFPAGAGTGALANSRPGKIAPVAAALLQAGALVGATGNMHELAFGITSNNAVTGAAQSMESSADSGRIKWWSGCRRRGQDDARRHWDRHRSLGSTARSALRHRWFQADGWTLFRRWHRAH